MSKASDAEPRCWIFDKAAQLKLIEVTKLIDDVFYENDICVAERVLAGIDIFVDNYAKHAFCDGSFESYFDLAKDRLKIFREERRKARREEECSNDALLWHTEEEGGDG